jgi:hypothetical protein
MTSTNTVILPTFTNTPVPIPCNRAAFVSDVSHPDGTDVTAVLNLRRNGASRIRVPAHGLQVTI